MCDFTGVFRQSGAGERIPCMANFFPTLLATCIAHGTNLGLAMMANSVDEGITADNLQEMSQWCLREEHLSGECHPGQLPSLLTAQYRLG